MGKGNNVHSLNRYKQSAMWLTFIYPVGCIWLILKIMCIEIMCMRVINIIRDFNTYVHNNAYVINK
jgi:hypothetical protein